MFNLEKCLIIFFTHKLKTIVYILMSAYNTNFKMCIFGNWCGPHQFEVNPKHERVIGAYGCSLDNDFVGFKQIMFLDCSLLRTCLVLVFYLLCGLASICGSTKRMSIICISD